ncbi:MAG: type III pantothenate kinase [Flavobacteriaceae bacterium]|nr:type III pantothenate kinase [Flavobacteriaceae bacterium]
MTLILDAGNTRVKVAVFDKRELLYSQSIAYSGFKDELNRIKDRYPSIVYAIISSVKKISEADNHFLKNNYTLLVLNHNHKFPFINKYSTPETLGLDRMALVSAASYQYPGMNVLIIDAGTCITYDFINHKNEYLGGAISPGLSMRYKALHQFTANLPELSLEKPKKTIGNSTISAIHSGVVNGVLLEIRGKIEIYKQNYNPLTIILTGGDAHFLLDSLKSGIFANSNFLLQGLNHILEINLKT